MKIPFSHTISRKGIRNMFFEELEIAPPDPIFGLAKTFQQDPRKEKEYLCVGVYQDEEKKMPIFKSVKQAKSLFIQGEEIANYLPFEGLDTFNQDIAELVFGEAWQELKYRTYMAQSLGGTGALRIGSEFISSFVTKNAYVSSPTWPNHFQLLKKSQIQVSEYPYFSKNYQIDFNHLIDFMTRIPERSLVVLHACCHNPTGADLSYDQWKELSALMLRRRLIPFFDFAYQGLGKGLNEDAYAVRLFASEGHEMLVAYTCSKNFSLYSHRTGCLFIVSQGSSQKEKIESQVGHIIRANYSNPPKYGAMIVNYILKNDMLRKLWESEVQQIRERLTALRIEFVNLINKNLIGKNFDYILKHRGIFSFLDINEDQVAALRDNFGVYLSKNGRMNFAGLNRQNMQFVADSVIKVLR